VCAYVRECVYLCVCVSVQQFLAEQHLLHTHLCVCVCVCVCAKESESACVYVCACVCVFVHGPFLRGLAS